MADVERCSFKQEDQSKASEQHQTWKWQKKDIDIKKKQRKKEI